MKTGISEIQCFERNHLTILDAMILSIMTTYTNKDAMSDTALCNGCCVKMVQFIGTGTEKIR